MAFCTSCGQQVADGAKFCANCGTATLQMTSEGSNARKNVYEGKIHKCPNCGEILKSFETICPSCKFELRGVKTSSSVSELAKKISELDEKKSNSSIWEIAKRKLGGSRLSAIEEEKISLISNFPIPNTKEDILEFMLLSSSHVLCKTPSGDISEHDKLLYNELKKAWKMKFEQAYDKAKICISNDEDRQEIEQCYIKAVIKPKERRKKIAVISIVSAISAVIIIVCILLFAPRPQEAEDPNLIAVGISYEDVEGQYYEDVIEMFENNGFINVEARGDGWNLFHKEGKVKRVTIDGKDEFYSSSKFSKDAKIIVFYYE